MSQQIRKEVLRVFKKLHRTRECVFKGDVKTLAAARTEINTKFRNNNNVSDENEIKKLIKLAEDVDKELRTNVVQAVEKEAGLYQVKIREEVPRLENVPFNPDAIIEKPRRGASKCGGGTATTEVKIRQDIPRLEDVPFNPDAMIQKPRGGGHKCGGGPQCWKNLK